MSSRIKTMLKYQWPSLLPTLVSAFSLLIVLGALDLYELYLAMSLGVIVGGVMDFDNRFAGKVYNILTISVFCGIACAVVIFTIESYFWMAILSIIVSFFNVMFGALNRALKTVGFGAVLCSCYSIFLVSGAASPEDGVVRILFMFAAILYYTLVSLVVHLLFPNRQIKNNISDLYMSLATFLQIKGCYFDPDDNTWLNKCLLGTHADYQTMLAEQIQAVKTQAPPETRPPEGQNRFSRSWAAESTAITRAAIGSTINDARYAHASFDDFNQQDELLSVDPHGFYNRKYENSRNHLLQTIDATKQSLVIRLKAFSKRKVTADMLRYYLTADAIFKAIDFNLNDYQPLKDRLVDSDIMFRIQKIFSLLAQAANDFAYGLGGEATKPLDPKILVTIERLEDSINKQHALHYYHVDRLTLLLTKLKKAYWLLQNISQKQRLQATSQASPNLAVSADAALAHGRGEHVPDEQAAQRAARQAEFAATGQAASASLQQAISATMEQFAATSSKISLGGMLRQLLSEFSFKSQTFRHAVRIVILLSLALALFPYVSLQYAFWFMMSGVLVIQPNYTNTKSRVRMRVFGSIVGAVIGGMVAFDIHETPILLSLIAAITLTLFRFTAAMNYGYSTMFLTVAVFATFRIAGAHIDLAVVMERIFANIAGATTCYFVMLWVFPEWNYLNLLKPAQTIYEKNKKLLLSVAGIVQKHAVSVFDLNKRLHLAANAHLQLQSLASQLVAEPKIYKVYLAPTVRFMAFNDYILSNLSLITQVLIEKLEDAQAVRQALYCQALASWNASHLPKTTQPLVRQAPPKFPYANKPGVVIDGKRLPSGFEEYSPQMIANLGHLAILYSNLYTYSEDELIAEVQKYVDCVEQQMQIHSDSAFDVNLYLNERMLGIAIALIGFRKELAQITQMCQQDPAKTHLTLLENLRESLRKEFFGKAGQDTAKAAQAKQAIDAHASKAANLTTEITPATAVATSDASIVNPAASAAAATATKTATETATATVAETTQASTNTGSNFTTLVTGQEQAELNAKADAVLLTPEDEARVAASANISAASATPTTESSLSGEKSPERAEQEQLVLESIHLAALALQSSQPGVVSSKTAGASVSYKPAKYSPLAAFNAAGQAIVAATAKSHAQLLAEIEKQAVLAIAPSKRLDLANFDLEKELDKVTEQIDELDADNLVNQLVASSAVEVNLAARAQSALPAVELMRQAQEQQAYAQTEQAAQAAQTQSQSIQAQLEG